jgi:2-dehydropantoate 2-reductase
MGCVVHASCSLDAPGFVRHHFGNRLIMGEPDRAADSARVQALADAAAARRHLRRCRLQIQKDIWFKLWGNLTVNPISALTGATTDRILDDDLVRGFVSAVMLEAKAIGARSASRSTSSPKTATPSRASWARSRPRCCRTWKPSKPLEIDALVGGARAGPDHQRAHPLHRCPAGPGAGARAGAWAVLKFDLVP